LFFIIECIQTTHSTAPDREASELEFPCCRPRGQYLGDKLEVNSNEQVIWINSKGIIKTLFSFLLMIIYYLVFIEEKKTSPLRMFHILD
jgi:hypothetical protein